MPDLQAVIAAAGEGRRFGGETPKQLLEIAGRPVVAWAIDVLSSRAALVVVALPEAHVGSVRALFEGRRDVRCVAGGTSRWRSVSRALAVLEGAPDDLVAIHDGARPALALEDLDAVLAAAGRSGAAVLGRSLGDTLKRVDGDRVVETLDRDGLFRAETPQVFARELLSRMAALATEDGLDPTDESFLAERLDGVRVTAVAARHPNPKITRRGDLRQLEALLETAAARARGEAR